MKLHYDEGRRAQVYAIEAVGNSLTEAVRNGLDQACEAVDRIVEGARREEKPTDYHVIDIVLRCPEAELLRAEATTYWAQAEPNLQAFFPMNSLVFWAAVTKLPEPEPEIVQKVHAFFARIAAQNAIMKYSQFRCSQAYLLGEFEAMMLAVANRQYVPCYTSLLRHWDMEHESREQYDSINDLVMAHGPCPEVDDLIATRLIEAPGQHGFEQFQELHAKIVEWYGDPLESPVYKCAEQKMKQSGVTDHTALQEIFMTDWSDQ
jgi:nitroreductase